jgi:hypothetical protein
VWGLDNKDKTSSEYCPVSGAYAFDDNISGSMKAIDFMNIKGSNNIVA